jgi:hypothetical protein
LLALSNSVIALVSLMSDYTFSTLAPNEFEDLSKDLVERHLNVPLQAFTTGCDGGIDLRHAPAVGQPWIVQCKHYAGSRFADLKKSVSKEIANVTRLKPERYILVTSCGLTPKNVDRLYALLSPYCVSKHDILGKSDLNAILRSNGDIERRHPKLWITSEAVLTKVLQNDVFVQSDVTRESILRRLSLYVYTPRFDDAIRKLNNARVCIISGVPGVGKTTLAEMLLLHHLRDGWELVTIHQNVSEGLRALQLRPEARQVFYYDDFLGQISSGEKLAKNEDGALLQLLGAVQQSASKRFILTTREYILTQAKREHEKLGRAGLDIYRFVVECRDYDAEAKARVLANHLYFNEVPRQHIAAIVRNEGYREIIEHDNYNPRLIEAMTSRLEVGSMRPSGYLRAFVARLDDPSQLWEHIYEEQLTEASRHVLLAMVADGAPTVLSRLEHDFETLFDDRSREFGWKRHPNDFARSLNELEGNFIRIRDRGREQVVHWHNASVLDFMSSWLRRHPKDTECLLRTAERSEQIVSLIATVLMPLANEGRAVDIRPSEVVLADSILRTATIATWGRLWMLLRLADQFDDGPLRLQLVEAADRLFRSLEISSDETPTVIAVLEKMENCSWVEIRQIADWRHCVRSFSGNIDHDSFDRLDDLVPLARWIVRNRKDLTGVEFTTFQKLSEKVVETESDAMISPNAASIWIEMKETVEELQSILSMDFGRAIARIERKIESAPKRDFRLDQIENRNERPRTSTIESIFEALIS